MNELAPLILLAESDPALREALTFSLELEGFRVSAFASAEAMLDEAGADADCLVIDYRLVGKDGLMLLDLLRDRRIAAPAILVASTPSRAVRAKTAAAGAVLVEKPLLCDTLTVTIRAELQARRQAA